eukprot:EG_transcript_22790
MNYNHYAAEAQGPSKALIAGVACTTTVVVAAATFVLTANTDASSMYTAPAVRTAPSAVVAPVTRRANLNAASVEEVVAPVYTAPQVASSGNQTLLVASFSSMALAVAAAMAAAFGYRSDAIAMASKSGAKIAPKGGKARGGQVGVGYKGSTEPGSAPPTRDGKPGYVYKLGLKNGLGNVDEYSPIYTPETWKKDGDVYEPGATGLALWAAGLLALLGVSAYLIYATSQL